MNLMTEDGLLRIILPVYFSVYFGIAFVLKSILVARKIGKNPLVLPNDDTAFGLVGLYFKLTLIVLFIYIFVFACFPNLHDNFMPITYFSNSFTKYAGYALLGFALVWTIMAQRHMKTSWRIGIDKETKTELVTTGLFSFSRNPIFFGMIMSLAGLFLATPNALTGLFFILSYVLIQIQIRLEEEFLAKEHGEKYLEYKKMVRRLI